jgi:hypothetical protein
MLAEVSKHDANFHNVTNALASMNLRTSVTDFVDLVWYLATRKEFAQSNPAALTQGVSISLTWRAKVRSRSWVDKYMGEMRTIPAGVESGIMSGLELKRRASMPSMMGSWNICMSNM